MPDDTIYMTPLPANEGTIYMEPLSERSDVIYMYNTNPTIDYEWRMIGIYTFQGDSCSTSWNMAAVGNYAASSYLITTDAVRVRVVARSGNWWDGSHYRGMMDVKTQNTGQHMGFDWTGTYYGYNTPGAAAAYWARVSGEIDIGDDKIFAWGGYDLIPADNLGSLTFSLLGKFIK
jgi:hypothetical protein